MKKSEFKTLISQLEKGLNERYRKTSVEVTKEQSAYNNIDEVVTMDIGIINPVNIEITYNQIDDYRTSTNKYGHTFEYVAPVDLRKATIEVTKTIGKTIITRYIEVMVTSETDNNNNRCRKFNFSTDVSVLDVETDYTVNVGNENWSLQTTDVYYDKEWSFAPLSYYVAKNILGHNDIYTDNFAPIS